MRAKHELFETKHVKMWISDGVIHTEYTPNLVITLEIAKKIVEDRVAYTNGIIYPGLADIRNLKKVEFPAMKYWATEEAYEGLSKLAVYSDNMLSKVFYNFWFKVNKPCKPTKYFTENGSAYLYLKSLNFN